jgi:hypothetical protein
VADVVLSGCGRFPFGGRVVFEGSALPCLYSCREAQCEHTKTRGNVSFVTKPLCEHFEHVIEMSMLVCLFPS